jgi:hypothetical protein
LLYPLTILHFELIEFHLEQLIFFLTDLFVTHIDFLELHPHFMGGFKAKTRSNNSSSSASKIWFLARAFHLASLSVGTVGNRYMVVSHTS